MWCIPLFGDVTRISKALYFDTAGKREALARLLKRQAITLESALGHHIDFYLAASLMADGMADTLNLVLVKEDLTESETNRVASLRSEKYAHKAWTHRR